MTTVAEATNSFSKSPTTANVYSAGVTDLNGKLVDLCDVYRDQSLPCPAAVAKGLKGELETLPVAALLKAGGIEVRGVYFSTLWCF